MLVAATPTAEATADIRARFWKDEGIAEDAHVTLDISDRFGAHALKRVLVILGRVPQDPIAIAAFTRASHTLAGWWTSDDDRRGGGHRAESDVSQRIQEFPTAHITGSCRAGYWRLCSRPLTATLASLSPSCRD